MSEYWSGLSGLSTKTSWRLSFWGHPNRVAKVMANERYHVVNEGNHKGQMRHIAQCTILKLKCFIFHLTVQRKVTSQNNISPLHLHTSYYSDGIVLCNDGKDERQR